MVPFSKSSQKSPLFFSQDADNGVLLAIGGVRVHVISLSKRWLAVILLQTAETMVGMLPNCCALLSTPADAVCAFPSEGSLIC
jgi:hypothetical protein